jgi:D-alanyl-D-alanine carboxypeptidase
VIDGDSGRVLLDQRAHERRSPASTTKIMTAILALETVSPDAWVVSSTDASRMYGSSVMGLRPGVYIQMRDLLYGLMLPSGNDAAIEIARNVDGTTDAFVARMNAKAAELGLANTHFVNPHGLDRRAHYSTAYDLAMLGRYAMRNDAFRRLAGTTAYHLPPPSDYPLYNGNSLLNTYPGADGIKIGWTNRAGWTLVASAERDGRRLYVTVLKSVDRDADAAALFDWAYSAYHWRPLTPSVTGAMRMAARMGVGSALARSLSQCG